MSKPAPSLHDKLNQLRERFIEQLPPRLATTKEQWQHSRLSAEEQTRLAPELHRFFHSLKGTGRSLGFERLALLADQAETALTSCPTRSDIDTYITQLLQQMEREQQHLRSHHGQQQALAAVNSFELTNQAEPLRNKRQRLIYLCDDEPEQVSHLIHHLRCFGHEVVQFIDTGTFFNAVLTRRPDAVIMDVHFPQGQTAGTETLTSLNKLTGEQLPAIVLSAHGDFHSRLSAVRAGCGGYFTKPVKPLDLMLAVDELTAPAADEPLKVLIVDDEPEVAAYHALLLEEASMIVQQVPMHSMH